METTTLIRKAKQGNQEALLDLIMAKENELYRLAYTYTSNHADATDAMQDMTLIIYRKISKLKDAQAFYSWAKTILVNCCRTILKKRGKVIPFEDAMISESSNNIQELENTLYLEHLLAKLSFKHQEVIRLRYYLDLDYQTIAEITKTPLGTVKSRLNIGLGKLRSYIEDENNE